MTQKQKTIHKWFRAKGWSTKGTPDNTGSILLKEEYITEPYHSYADEEEYTLHTALEITIDPTRDNFVSFLQSSWLTRGPDGEEVTELEDIALRSSLLLPTDIYTTLTVEESLRLAQLIEEIAKEAKRK